MGELIHKIAKTISPYLSDKQYIRLKWAYAMKGAPLNLYNPQTYSEKLQWLKLYYHNPQQTLLVDKFKVKEYVSTKIGAQYVIPLLGVWNSVEEIDWESLPSQFVMKCSHDCGGMVVCKDKNKLDIEEAKKNLKKCMETNYYYASREWPYKNVEPVIFAEEYKEDEFGELRDYKWFCFDGEPKALFIATDRGKGHKQTRFDFYDMDFNHLPFTNGHPNSDKKITKPLGFEKMKELASILSKGFPHVRVDFYDVNGTIYFGEFTFYHWGGMMPFEPKEWDYKFGSWIKLPPKMI